MEKEIWKDIAGYEGLYQVSNFGRIKSLRSKIILASLSSKSGYCYVGLAKNGMNKQKSVHRLVALAFIPNSENKPEVNHIDGNKHNNTVKNLEWVTKSENMKHCRQILGKHIGHIPKKLDA